jgi:hypothetical protein
MPAWVKNAIDAWTVVAGVTEGHLFFRLWRLPATKAD